MDPDRTRRALEILEAALELKAEEREACVRELCGDDAALAVDVRASLAADEACWESFWEGGALRAHARLQQRAVQDALGTTIGSYELIAFVGEGGSGTVYRACPRKGIHSRREFVALKIMRPGTQARDLLGRFHDEARALSTLRHPNVLSFRETGVSDAGLPYLVTEFVEGRPIDRAVAEDTPSFTTRLDWSIQIAEGMCHAHRHLIVHRDLKPSNVLITDEGQVKILDFGIAKWLGEDPERGWTRPAERGPLSLPYASPEQRRGDPLTVATDVYSLGVLLHELWTGRRPESEGSGFLAPSRVLAREPGTRGPSPRQLRGDVDAICLRALAEDPAERYASMDALLSDLRCVQRHLPIAARRTPAVVRVVKWWRRHPWPALILLVLTLAVGYGWWITDAAYRRVSRSESLAWRAHAEAVHVTRLLSDVVERLARGELREPEAVARLIERSEGRIADQMGSAPEAEARLRHALARASQALGDHDLARRHVDRALALTRTTRGLGPRDLRDVLETAVRVHLSLERTSALPLARELVDLCHDLPTSDGVALPAARALEAEARARFGEKDPEP